MQFRQSTRLVNAIALPIFFCLTLVLPVQFSSAQTPTPEREIETQPSETEAIPPAIELDRIPPPEPPLEMLPLGPTDPATVNAVTSNTISPTGLTVPSLWWAREQFGKNLVENWLAYPRQSDNTGFVDLIVNRQIWNALDYLERYEFLNHFGQAATDYLYNIRVFTPQKSLIASYTCNYSVQPIACNIWINSARLEEEIESNFPQPE